MALRKPLVHLDDNNIGELPAGDTLPGTFPAIPNIPDPASAAAADLHATVLEILQGMRTSGRLLPAPMTLTGDYPDATVGVPYNAGLTLGGTYTAPVTFAVTDGAIPAGPGWAFNTSTSVLSNADPVDEETATFSVTATDSSVPPQIVEAGPFSVTVNPAGGGTPIIIGDTGSGGQGNWPTSANRALLRRITVTETVTITQFNMRIHPNSTGIGERFKGLIYAADGAGGEPGTLLLVSDPTGPTAGGAELLTAAASGVITPQEIWEGYVSNGASGVGCETDSGGQVTNATIMLNAGETNYANPSNPCGDWPGGPGPYTNIPALWFDGTYVP